MKNVSPWLPIVPESGGTDCGKYIDDRRSAPTFIGTDEYLVVPRSVLQSMPRFWQFWLVKLLKHMDSQVAWIPGCGYRVERLDSEGKKSIDPYREWKAPNGKLRKILSWRDVRSATLKEGIVTLRAEARKPVLAWMLNEDLIGRIDNLHPGFSEGSENSIHRTQDGEL